MLVLCDLLFRDILEYFKGTGSLKMIILSLFISPSFVFIYFGLKYVKFLIGFVRFIHFYLFNVFPKLIFGLKYNP